MWWIPAVMGAVQAGYGMFQMGAADRAARKARKEMKAARPGIPKSAEMMVSRAERVFTEGAQRGTQREMLGQSTAAGVSALREGAVSSSQYVGGVTDMYRAELENLNRIAMEESAFRLQAGEGVQRALQHRAGYENQNQMMGYQEAGTRRQEAVQAGQSGVQNMWGGLQTGVSAFMTKYQTGEEQKFLKDIYGVGGNNAPQTSEGTSMFGKNYKVGSQLALPKLDALRAIRESYGDISNDYGSMVRTEPYYRFGQ
jgi:hypothetical protein